MSKVADAHNLFITIKRDETGHSKSYGPKTGHPVPLALIENHYVHVFRTPITGWSLDRFWELQGVERWYDMVGPKRHDRTQGLMSHNLLRKLLSLPFLLEKIDISSDSILKTTGHSNVDKFEFSTLEYDECYARPLHPPRFAYKKKTSAQKKTQKIIKS
jgi:hypothetical protein